MAIRECDCREFQDSGHTDECNEHYNPEKIKPVIGCINCGHIFDGHFSHCKYAKEHLNDIAPELLEALKDAHSCISDDELRIRIGNLIVKAEGHE